MTPTEPQQYYKPPQAEQDTTKEQISELILAMNAYSSRAYASLAFNTEEDYLTDLSEFIKTATTLISMTRPFIKDEASKKRLDEINIILYSWGGSTQDSILIQNYLKTPKGLMEVRDSINEELNKNKIYELGRPSHVKEIIQEF